MIIWKGTKTSYPGKILLKIINFTFLRKLNINCLKKIRKKAHIKIDRVCTYNFC
jgi:hypothetical protein